MNDVASKPIPGARPYFPEEDLPGVLEEIGEVLRGGRLILGPKTKQLEADWSKRVGTKHAVAVSSCTAALEIAMRHYKVAGGEVVVPTNTFVATANAVIYSGGRVVFSDMDEGDYCLDADDTIAKLTSATKAVIVVHIAGFVSRHFDKVVDACRARGIKIIEDCAHAHGSTFKGKEAGSLGDAGCFSLYPTKVLTSCVGGVLTTDDEELATFARSVRHHGQGASLEQIVVAGSDWVLDEVRAVLARSQLSRLDDFLATRRKIAAKYDEMLRGDARFVLPTLHPELVPAWYKYPVLIPEGADRDGLRKRIYDTHKIEIGALYSPPAHLMPVFEDRRVPLPRAERTLSRQICLPMHACVTDEDAERSVALVRAAL